MRLTICSLAVGLLLISCADKVDLTISQELSRLASPPQTFNISDENSDTLVTVNGSRIILQPNIFMFEDGGIPLNAIKLEVTEVFNKSEMILNGIGTVSDGRLIESMGMVNLRAVSDRRELKLKENSKIGLWIPNKNELPDGELFYGEKSGSFLNWVYGGPKKDTTYRLEKITELSYGSARVDRSIYKLENGIEQWVSDTAFWINNYRPSDSVTWESAIDRAMVIPGEYQFEVSRLGWINCDRFVEYPGKTILHLNLEEFRQPLVFLVFPEINSIMDVYFDSAGVATVEGLPVNFPAELIAIDKIDGQFRWGKLGLIIGKSDNITVRTKAISIENLQSEILKFNR